MALLLNNTDRGAGKQIKLVNKIVKPTTNPRARISTFIDTTSLLA